MAEIHQKQPPPDSPEEAQKRELDLLVSDYLDAINSVEKGKSLIADLAELIIKKIPAGSKHEITAGVGVRVQAPSKTFNAMLARAVLTPEQYAVVCEPKPSAKLAEKMLPGVLVDLCRAEGAAPVVKAL